MPRVNGKEYPYTAAGMKAAENAKKKQKPKLGGPVGKPKPAAPAKPQMPQRPGSRRRIIPLDTPPKPRPLPQPVSKTRISGATTSRGSMIGGISGMPKQVPTTPRRRGGAILPKPMPAGPRKKTLLPKKMGR